MTSLRTDGIDRTDARLADFADVMADRHWLTDGTDTRLPAFAGVVADRRDRHDRRWLTCRTDGTDRTGLGVDI